MERSKLVTYFGFAKRSGKLTAGVNAAQTLKRGVYLLVADQTVAKNSRKIIISLQAKLNCPLFFVDNLGELVLREGCKLVAVREENLARAIVEQLNG